MCASVIRTMFHVFPSANVLMSVQIVIKHLGRKVQVTAAHALSEESALRAFTGQGEEGPLTSTTAETIPWTAEDWYLS